MGFTSIRDRVDLEVYEGQSHIVGIRKQYTQQTISNAAVDLSLAPGTPPANYYASAPLEAAHLDSAKGLYHGPNVAPKTKHLSKILMIPQTVTSIRSLFTLVDVLQYYPFLDMDSTDTQALTNPVSLPRYQSGVGVMAYIVAQGSYTGGGSVTITYTNSDGVPGRVSPVCTVNTAGFAGCIVNSWATGANRYPMFLPLQDGDLGVRSVESVTFLSGNGGIGALVLCRPLASQYYRENMSPTEKDFFLESGMHAPRVLDGAYLSFLILPSSTLNVSGFTGIAEFVWG